jgi:hypothetical protein
VACQKKNAAIFAAAVPPSVAPLANWLSRLTA